MQTDAECTVPTSVKQSPYCSEGVLLFDGISVILLVPDIRSFIFKVVINLLVAIAGVILSYSHAFSSVQMFEFGCGSCTCVFAFGRSVWT